MGVFESKSLLLVFRKSLGFVADLAGWHPTSTTTSPFPWWHLYQLPEQMPEEPQLARETWTPIQVQAPHPTNAVPASWKTPLCSLPQLKAQLVRLKQPA